MNYRKTILIIEDSEANRCSLIAALSMREFNAIGASTVSEARKLIAEVKEQIDVMVLDMRLEDPAYPEITGADIGIEVLKTHPEWPPDFLIFSAYRQIDYYQNALELGAATYLVKGTLSQDDVIRHIRSLALRHALSIQSKEVRKKVERIAETNESPSAAIMNLCCQVLAPEMKSCLGSASIFLLSDSEGTQNCTSDSDIPLGYYPAFETVQALTFGSVNSTDPFIFDLEHVGAPPDAVTYNIYQKLDGSAFLPLFIAHGFRLSIGILRTDESLITLPEEPSGLARILAPYLRPVILEHLINVLPRLRTAIERRALLQHTSRFCLYVGQTQLSVLNEAVDNNGVEVNNEYIQKLKKLALDLCATGNEFSQLSNINNSSEALVTNLGQVSASITIQRAWNEIKEQFTIRELSFDESGESFNIEIDQNDFLVIVLRLLQWMVQREDKTPTDVKPHIGVEYVKHSGRGEIIFTDRSRRLGKPLRDTLFDPFNQATTLLPLTDEQEERPGLYLPLYLAKMLVEVKNNGLLEDRSDDLDSKIGHSFVISFPLKEEHAFTADIATGT